MRYARLHLFPLVIAAFLLPAHLVTASVIYAQDKDLPPNVGLFIGSWKFDAKASDLHPALTEEHLGEVIKTKFDWPVFTLVKVRVVNQEKRRIGLNEFLIKGAIRSSVMELRTDKSGEVMSPYPFNPDLVIGSKSYWKRGTLNREWSTEIFINGRKDGELKTVESHSISKDGSSFYIRVESNETRGRDPMKFVYRRCDTPDCKS